MSSVLRENARLQCRELQMGEIEARWPPELRRRLHTNAGDNRIYGVWRQTFRTGLFDFLWPFLDPARAAVDVGALLGQYSLTLAAWSTRCVCVEPLEQYRFMGRTLPPNCIWRTVAAGERPGRGTIRSPVSADSSVDFGLSSLERHDWPTAVSVREQETEIRPLDEIVPEALGDEPVGFMKIDVEGYELEVLRGARRTIVRHRPTLLVETEDVPAVGDLMRDYGYRGLFFFRRRLIDLAEFDPQIHRAPEHAWSPERRHRFNPDMVMSDLYFIPAEQPAG